MVRVTDPKLLQSWVERGLLPAEAVSVPPSRPKRRRNGRSPVEAELERRLLAEFGHVDDGGEAVPELIPLSSRRWRVDLALPRWRVALEVDGFTDHASLKGFKRDRQKDLDLQAHGWLVVRLTRCQIQDDSLIPQLHQVLRHRIECTYQLERLPKGWYRMVAMPDT